MHHEGSTVLCLLVSEVDGNIEIDMTPPNVLAETVKQVVKILKSPGCRSVCCGKSTRVVHSNMLQENPSIREVVGNGYRTCWFVWN